MKTLTLVTALALAVPLNAWAQDFTTPKSVPEAITGTMSAEFGTRTNTDDKGAPATGAKDTYTVDLTLLNSVVLRGNVVRLPWLPNKLTGTTSQDGNLAYDLKTVLKNPANPNETRALGGWVGAMRLDGYGKYFLGDSPEGKGKLRIATDSIGKITGFTSDFGGQIQGRVPEQAGIWGLASRASKKVNKVYLRNVGGKSVKHEVANADPMTFDKVELAQGPLAGYSQTRLNGSIDYDAEQGIWYVDVKANYSSEGKDYTDRMSGTIRWNEDANRKTNGIGWYDVNVRLNEKIASESDAFLPANSTSEDAFFASDTAVPGFTGRIDYVDKMEGETVTASKVTYKVAAAEASKIQVANLAKILMLMIGPFNDE